MAGEEESSTDSPVICNIKPAKYLTIGTNEFYSGCAVIEIVFPTMRPADIGRISFVNNYSATLSVKMKVQKTSGNQQSQCWITGLRNYTLMPKPHCETGSQSYFNLTRSDFCKPPDGVSALRLILRQPSPNWKTFTLEEIYIHAKTDVNAQSSEIPKWLANTEDVASSEIKPRDQAHLNGLPDPEAASENLLEILQLAQKAVQSTPKVELGRFDIEGSYEINLLSYT